MKRFNLKALSFLLVTSMFVASCGDDEPMIPDDLEVITQMSYILTPTAGGDAITLNFDDPDGDGGNAPTVTGGTLSANTSYTGRITLSNPDEDVTPEITEEDEEHQFFFAISGANLTIDYADMDANGDPIGLTTTLTTTDASSGNLTITLRHKPDKAGTGVAGGDISNAGGDTDIEVTFSVDIQ
ncbi:MAG: type 1 periplasmic binding fold superfamily protein [Bacteroidota bacterium]